MALEVGKYLSGNFFFILFQVAIKLDGRWYNHSFALSANEDEKALSLTCSLVSPIGFMLK